MMKVLVPCQLQDVWQRCNQAPRLDCTISEARTANSCFVADGSLQGRSLVSRKSCFAMPRHPGAPLGLADKS